MIGNGDANLGYHVASILITRPTKPPVVPVLVWPRWNYRTEHGMLQTNRPPLVLSRVQCRPRYQLSSLLADKTGSRIRNRPIDCDSSFMQHRQIIIHYLFNDFYFMLYHPPPLSIRRRLACEQQYDEMLSGSTWQSGRGDYRWVSASR